MNTAKQDSATPALPKETTQATDLLDLMMRLADLLASETGLVRSGQVQDIAPLQREKLRLTLLYQNAIKSHQAGGTKLATLPAPLRAQIVAASARLAEAVGKNERALRIGRDATRRLVDMVVASLKDRLKPMSRYDARCTMRPAAMVPCAVDRRF
jgi:hypothetical protein